MRTSTEILCKYGLLSYLAVLLNISGYLRKVECPDLLTFLFVVAVFLTYGLLYMLPVWIPLLALDWVLGRWAKGGLLDRLGLRGEWVVWSTAVVLSTALHLLLFSDRQVYETFDFHINGFIWNVITTEGGIESMGATDSMAYTLAWIVLGFFCLQAGLLVALLRVRALRTFLDRALSLRALVMAAVLLVFGALFERATYAVSSARNNSAILSAAPAFPLYLPFTAGKLFKYLGWRKSSAPSLQVDLEGQGLNYPLKPLPPIPEEKRLNIVWLACESLRADALDPQIMPSTWAFAQRSCRFKNHYSGGNGTRMGVFSMFYGLYGCYWFPFLEQNRGPVLIDLLKDAGYRMELFTSASFTSPEFNKTVFARVEPQRLHRERTGPSWQRDRANVEQILRFIEGQRPGSPFLTFMFFESPHAQYDFPPECAIRRPYLEDFNYLTVDRKANIDLIRNRYLNSCNHLDTQIQRIVDLLEQRKLLDSTILLVTGDHGEEFLEKGHWGHGSGFTEEQTRVPLVLWIPGVAPRQVERLTSHLDLPATILKALGVSSPPQDYSLGFDLLGDQVREFNVLADWSNLAYQDDRFKALFPMKSFDLTRQKVTTQDDREVADPEAFYRSRRARILQVMGELKRFTRR